MHEAHPGQGQREKPRRLQEEAVTNVVESMHECAGRLVTWSQRPPRATRGGCESGAGAPAVRPQHVEVRVEERRAGGLADRKSHDIGGQ